MYLEKSSLSTLNATAMIQWFSRNLQLNYKTFLLLLLASLGLMVVFGSIPPFNYWTFDHKNLSSSKFADYGQFISGFLGTLFTLISAGLLFKTLIDQKKQFLESSFQNNFYSLLENHRAILSTICDKVEGVSAEDETGADFFADLAQRISIDYTGVTEVMGDKSITPIDITSEKGLNRLIKIYDHYFHIHQSDLGHYFRNLYHFVKFIIESDVDPKFKGRHMKILRAQLSNYEMLVLAYNCLHRYGAKFKPFVEEFELLQNLNFEIGLDERYVKRIVDPSLLVTAYPHLKKPFEEQGLNN